MMLSDLNPAGQKVKCTKHRHQLKHSGMVNRPAFNLIIRLPLHSIIPLDHMVNIGQTPAAPFESTPLTPLASTALIATSASSRTSATAWWPAHAASCNGVALDTSTAFGVAPGRGQGKKTIKNRTTLKGWIHFLGHLPHFATSSFKYLLRESWQAARVHERLAPLFSKSSTSWACPLAAAQCNGVAPQ